MYKVFFNDRVVFINTGFNKSLIQNGIFGEIQTDFDVQRKWTEFLADPNERDLYLSGDSVENVTKLFQKNFRVINAAGGLVWNTSEQLLCIYRLNKWDLPKGKVEKGEAVEDAAIREVEEETGITGVQITGFKTMTYHIYQSPFHPNIWILKPTHWFNMKYMHHEILVPQVKENIVKAEWIDRPDLGIIKKNTYASLKALFDC